MDLKSKRVRNVYENAGWQGKEFESDYATKWGIVELADIFDGRGMKQGEAVRMCRSAGLEFMMNYNVSSGSAQVLRVTATNAKSLDSLMKYNIVKATKSRDDYANDLKVRVTQIVRCAKDRSKKNLGVDSDLDEADILDRVLVGKCEVTGYPFDLTSIGQHPFSPSLDQIVPGKGYTTDNIQVVCYIYNSMKRDFSDEHVTLFINHLRAID